jgi:hypothetical protein
MKNKILLFILLIICLIILSACNNDKYLNENKNIPSFSNQTKEIFEYEINNSVLLTNNLTDICYITNNLSSCNISNITLNNKSNIIYVSRGGDSKTRIKTVVKYKQLIEDWNIDYIYSDNYSIGGIEQLDDEIIEISRTYAWRGHFNNIFSGKVKIKQSVSECLHNDEICGWYGSRLAIVNTDNLLERYEIRFYLHQNKIQINYVDRTNRTGNYKYDLNNTISEVIKQTNCNINLNTWYYSTILRNNNKWKVIIMSALNPTCMIEWTDDRILGDTFAIGIQSAGKYVISEFDKVLVT